MAKFTFIHTTEWSDRSPHSPSHTGQLPCAVVLPDGERVELDEYARYMAGELLYNARMEGSKATYAQIHPNVRFRESHWGDDGSRRMGRAGNKMEVFAPKGSLFFFSRICPWCGRKSGEAEESELIHGKATPLYHVPCQAEADEQERFIEGHCRYVAEQEK